MLEEKKMVDKSTEEILNAGVIREENGTLVISDYHLFKGKVLDNLVDTIILGESTELKGFCQWIADQAGSG